MLNPPARNDGLHEAQRQYKGGIIDSNVTAQTLAEMLTNIADTDCNDEKSKAVIRAVARSLTNPNASHKLVLTRKKRGKPVDRIGNLVTRAETYIAVEKLKQDGWSVESAVAQVASDEGLSVSQVYRRISED